MKNLDITTPVKVLDYDELPAADRHIVELARKVVRRPRTHKERKIDIAVYQQADSRLHRARDRKIEQHPPLSPF